MAKVLLVEDNEMNRDMLTRRLQRKGFEVIIAADGREGVSRASAESPDLRCAMALAGRIGCPPCLIPARPGDDSRTSRWKLSPAPQLKPTPIRLLPAT